MIDAAVVALREAGGVDAHRVLAYDVAHAASALATARASLAYGARGDVESRLVAAFLALALSDLATRVLGREELWAAPEDWYRPFADFVSTYRDPAFVASLAESPGPRHLGEDFEMVAETFHRFALEQVRPHAEHVHRANADIPESVIAGLAELGGFGLSVPEEFGGFATGGESRVPRDGRGDRGALLGRPRRGRFVDHPTGDLDARAGERRHDRTKAALVAPSGFGRGPGRGGGHRTGLRQ